MIAKRKSPVSMEANEVTPDNESPADENAEKGPMRPAARMAERHGKPHGKMKKKGKKRPMRGSPMAKSFGGVAY